MPLETFTNYDGIITMRFGPYVNGQDGTLLHLNRQMEE